MSAARKQTPGRRVTAGEDGTHAALQPGEYVHVPGTNVWNVCSPDGEPGSVLAPTWKVKEHEDGTITVSPSIWFRKPRGWHGHLKRGVWTSV